MNLFTKMKTFTTFLLITLFVKATRSHDTKFKRSIDLSASHFLISESKLSRDVIPTNYEIYLHPNIHNDTFWGNIKMNLYWNVDSKKVAFHAHYDLNINDKSIKLLKQTMRENQLFEENIEISRTDRIPKKNIFAIFLKEAINKGTECILILEFDGFIGRKTEGLFKGSYIDTKTGEEQMYLATYLRPHNARRLFPCFDEPSFKVPYEVSISRQTKYMTLFNTPLVKTLLKNQDNMTYAIDNFQKTPPMSSFTFGFIVSKLNCFKHKEIGELIESPKINLWTNALRHEELEDIYMKLVKINKFLENFFNATLPLSKIDVIALPNLSLIKPADNWGILIFRENELFKKGYYGLALELIYQWLGCWVTPYWWNDAHLNKALASFLAAEVTFQLDNGDEFSGKYPMTLLYSLYYEFSKRYPHSRITGMKQETISFKTELVLRMFNFTFGRETFQNSIRRFLADRYYSTFFGDDLWDAISKQAKNDNCLPPEYKVSEIAGSWITKDRLPVVFVERDYERNTAYVTQKVYLRERPHDVPEQDKMLWWIPLTLVGQKNLNFKAYSLPVWMEKIRSITLTGISTSDQFIIINPEEIGPFPVSYDNKNWNLLSTFLQTEKGRVSIPPYTRAKLLHDAWNLAYAGDLSFAIALNMTLFMKYERDHVVWNPVFTFIDHIGRHIDMSAVHKKFEAYVIAILTPLYEELGGFKEEEERWITDLRSLAKTFLCRAGYRQCIVEAQQAFRLWINSPSPDLVNPVPNQYICPVFKWGTIKEWEFGLDRIINFSKSRIQSERTYLLKMLAGCPVHEEKIYRLLNLTVLEGNKNFTDNDIFLIFNMLTGGSSGYTTLFFFLRDNWTAIKQRFENKTNLWDSLIGSATGVFTTEEGYLLVKKLHEQRAGEFTSAEHIIEKSLRNIREEAKWTNENLPVIEKWLDSFLKTIEEPDVKFILNS